MSHHHDSLSASRLAARLPSSGAVRLGFGLAAALLIAVCGTTHRVDAAPAVPESDGTSGTVLVDTMPDWDKIRQVTGRLLTDSPPPSDPLTYFKDPLGREMGLQDAAQTLAAKRIPKALAAELKTAELAESARQLVRHLATWNLAADVQMLAQTTDDHEIDRLASRIRQQATWLKDGGHNIPLLPSILSLLPGLELEESERRAGQTDHDERYRDYVMGLDAKYPAVSDGSDSWLAVLERDGIRGWQERLRTVPDQATVSQEEARRYAVRYTDTRLRPLLRLKVAQQGSDLETWAAQQTYRHWLGLSQWKDAVRLRRGLTRLCGSWQWSVHNHQNHGEQKLVVSFPPPDAAPQDGGPAEIVALGDLVYLRWEAGGRMQEDSLLFSNEGQRLEGTFVNNAGGWGSITGKRTAGCPAK